MLLFIVLLVNIGVGIVVMRVRAARLGRQLVVAAYQLDVSEVRRLIDAGANVNARIDEHSEDLFMDKWARGRPMAASEWTPLLAVANSNAYPDPEQETTNTIEGLAEAERRKRLIPKEMLAARDGRRLKIAAMLVEAGAELNAHDFAGGTALYDAVYQAIFHSGYEALALFLIERGADVNTKTGIYIDGPGDNTPLHRASGNPRLARALIAKGADVHARTTEGDTPLHDAALDDNVEVAQLLIAAGADIHAANDAGDTPFSRFASALSESQMKELLQDVKASAKPP